MFSFRSSSYRWGRSTVAAVSAQWPVKHVKYALQNITTDGMPRIVLCGAFARPPMMFAHCRLTAQCDSVNTFSEFITLREVVNRGRGGRHQVAVDGGPREVQSPGLKKLLTH